MALDMTNFHLRHGDDLLAMDCITGHDVSITLYVTSHYYNKLKFYYIVEFTEGKPTRTRYAA